MNGNVTESNAVEIVSASHSLQLLQVANMSLSDKEVATATVSASHSLEPPQVANMSELDMDRKIAIAFQIVAAFCRVIADDPALSLFDVYDQLGILEIFPKTELEYQNLGQKVKIIVWNKSLKQHLHGFQGSLRKFTIPIGNGRELRLELIIGEGSFENKVSCESNKWRGVDGSIIGNVRTFNVVCEKKSLSSSHMSCHGVC